MEKAGYTRYVTDIFASTMKTNELSSIRTLCSLSNPPGSSHSAEARPATNSDCSRRVARAPGSQPRSVSPDGTRRWREPSHHGSSLIPKMDELLPLLY